MTAILLFLHTLSNIYGASPSLVNLTSNSNPTPIDSPKPSERTGIRFGSSAGTMRGLVKQSMHRLTTLIADFLEAALNNRVEQVQARLWESVLVLCWRINFIANSYSPISLRQENNWYEKP